MHRGTEVCCVSHVTPDSMHDKRLLLRSRSTHTKECHNSDFYYTLWTWMLAARQLCMHVVRESFSSWCNGERQTLMSFEAKQRRASPRTSSQSCRGRSPSATPPKTSPHSLAAVANLCSGAMRCSNALHAKQVEWIAPCLQAPQ